MSGLARRRAWRWAVGVWLGAVVVGGALTLWLGESGSDSPAGWEKARPSLSPSVARHVPTDCPTSVRTSGPDRIICVVSTG
ncbi:hypothetical protein [Streptomyces gilvus]|uniref:hypothetical protein n=1 Tax=Streptomyces gilvus TaxID=2920937 RepID=UPI001F0CF4A1|nr:hypothetical protein [Streptomyces sp. CME 23]MCH5677341.1 hypothetical protein [Streptomyces sp. CME 23]